MTSLPRRILRTRPGRAGTALLAPLLLVGLLSPLLLRTLPRSPSETDLSRCNAPPARAHLLGTDQLGRDVAARVIRASGISLSVGVLSTALAFAVALGAGSLAGVRGGWTDVLLSRLMEVVLSFPALFLILVLMGSGPPLVRAVPPLIRIALVLGLTGWIGMARHLRAELMKLRDAEFVLAARVSGASTLRLWRRHLLPNALPPMVVSATFFAAHAILLESSVSFLGFGIQPPEPSWGGMLADAQQSATRGWWLAFAPGVALFACVAGCNLLAEGLREALDPAGSSLVGPSASRALPPPAGAWAGPARPEPLR